MQNNKTMGLTGVANKLRFSLYGCKMCSCPTKTRTSSLSATHSLAQDVGTFNRKYAGSPGIFPQLRTDNLGVSKTRNSFPQKMPNHKKAGRPQKTAAKRIKKIDVRFTEEEYHIIAGLEETLGISKTELVRERLLHGARLTMINAKEMIGELDSIGTELGRSGNNINQLARYANILAKKSILSPQVMEQFNILFEQYIENQRGLETALRKIIRALGR